MSPSLDLALDWQRPRSASLIDVGHASSGAAFRASMAIRCSARCSMPLPQGDERGDLRDRAGRCRPGHEQSYDAQYRGAHDTRP